MLYNLLSKILLANNDFRLVKNAENDVLLSVIEKDIGENIDFPLESIIGDGMPGVFITLDGFVLHSCFSDAYHEEFEKMLSFFKGRKSEITEQDLASFYDTVSDTSFRILYEEASDKDIYMPSKNEFLKYVDDEYYEISLAEKQMRRYIEKNFLSKFAAVAKKIGISTSECINDFMEEIHYQATDVGKVGEERDPNELVQFVLDYINGYGVENYGVIMVILRMS